MSECSQTARRQYSYFSSVIFVLALLAATFFVNTPLKEIEPVIIGMIGGAVLAQTAVVVCQRFWNTVLWSALFTALIVIATAMIGYKNEAPVISGFVITGLIIITGFGLYCGKSSNRVAS
jgi:hypothetical protein